MSKQESEHEWKFGDIVLNSFMGLGIVTSERDPCGEVRVSWQLSGDEEVCTDTLTFLRRADLSV